MTILNAISAETPANVTSHAHRWGLAISVFILGAVIMAMSDRLLPLQVGDPSYFMPYAINYAAGEGLYNSVSTWSFSDPTGAGRLSHGYLQAMLYGTLLWQPSYRALFLIQGFVAVVTVVLTSVLFSSMIASSAINFRWATLIGAVLMLTGLVPLLLSGRPEPLVTLFYLLTVLVLVRVPTRYQFIPLGAGLLCVGITSPVGAILGGLLTGAYFSFGDQFRVAAMKYAATMTIAGVGIALTTHFVFPFGLEEWIAGMLHGTKFLNDFNASRLEYWFLNPRTFMLGALFIASLGSGLMLLYRNGSRVQCPIGLVVFGLAFAAASWRFAIWVSARNYNLFPFAPLACLPILAVISGSQWPAPGSDRQVDSALRYGLLLLAALPAIGTARLFLHCAISSRDGLDYAAARQIVDELRRNNSRIGLSTGLFALAEDQQGIDYFEVSDFSDGNVKSLASDVLVLQQSKTGTTVPPALDGYILESDYFLHHTEKVLGVPVAITPEAYN